VETKPDATNRSNPRHCYCHATNAEDRRARGIPDGFCGICERCGQPGHTQHFPGPVPYTGAWCDRCVRIVAWTWPLKNPVLWFVVIVVGLVVWSTLR
jgi:hypothetical protein